MFEEIRNVIVAQLELAEEDVQLKTTWEELKVDALDLVDIITELEDTYGLSLQDVELDRIKTVEDLVNLVQSKM